jgi:Vacuolar protein sorting-associated protein 62
MRVLCAALFGLLAFVPVGGAAAPATPPLATLLARHVPVLVLHPAERFQPVPVEGFLADSDLTRRTAAGWEKVEGRLPQGGADLRLDQRLCRAVEGVAATPCYAAAQSAHGARPVVYGAAFRKKGRIDLQYWLWYPFNPYSTTVPPGELWQVHEGDWEAVSVVLDLSGKPLVVGLSQHSKGVRREWGKAPKRGVHPLVYVALGSHANYFAPGLHRFDPRVIEPIFIQIISQNGGQPVDHAGNGRVVRPRLVRVTAAHPSWMAFAGRWGEDQYLHVPGGMPMMIGAGPRGPAFHEQWRAPVTEVLSWPRG